MSARQLPTMGRTVLYKLTARDVMTIEVARGVNIAWARGSHVEEGEVVPMTVTAVIAASQDLHRSVVNGQALLDGNDNLWVVESSEHLETDLGWEPGRWRWPPRG
jgi:hypothetical protein